MKNLFLKYGLKGLIYGQRTKLTHGQPTLLSEYRRDGDKLYQFCHLMVWSERIF